MPDLKFPITNSFDTLAEAFDAAVCGIGFAVNPGWPVCE